MSNPTAGLTVRGKQPPNVRIQNKMDYHLLQSLVGKDQLSVEIDQDQFGKWIASREKKTGDKATAGTLAAPAAAEPEPPTAAPAAALAPR
jgi:hypothetical protein